MVRARLGRAMAVVGCALVLLTGSLPSYADTEDDKRDVEEKLDKAKDHLHESSEKLESAAQALKAAEQKLASARDHLSSVQGQVKAARAKERALTAKAERAKERLAQAEQQLRQAVRRIERQRDKVGAVASANYRSGGGMRNVAVVLQSGSPTDLVDRLQYAESVSDGQRVMLEKLNAARAERAAKKVTVERLTERAEQRRQQAANQLERKQQLKVEARDAAAEVESLVDERAERKQVAEQEKRNDLERYRELKQERERIEKLLRQRQKDDDDDGGDPPKSPSSSGMIMPVDGPITSQYGMRMHPVLGYEKLHDGTDFGVGCGTPVRAASSGTVVDAYFNSGYGNRVIVDHGGGIATTYNHLSSFSVSAGDQVGQGDVVGNVGSTGYSTGCHLHFMVLENGTAVDPMGYLP